MKISVVIVSWNAKSYLLQCLESVLRQVPPDQLEVIVVDNASSDGSPDAVRDNYPSVNLICNSGNDGFAKGNNIGISRSTGDYLFLINSDVVVSEGCFEKLIQHMDEHPQVGMLGPKIFGADGKIQRNCMAYPSLWNMLCRALALDALFPRSRLFGGHFLTFWNFEDTRQVDVINGCFWVLRRSAMEEVGLLDERFFMYGEDVDWCRRFTHKGWRLVYFAEADALHYGGASSSNAPIKFDIERQRADYQYWTKHHSWIEAHAFLFISLLQHTLRIGAELIAYPLRRTRDVSRYKIKRGLASIKWILAGP